VFATIRIGAKKFEVYFLKHVHEMLLVKPLFSWSALSRDVTRRISTNLFPYFSIK
jgi:hypothetical protein